MAILAAVPSTLDRNCLDIKSALGSLVGDNVDDMRLDLGDCK